MVGVAFVLANVLLLCGTADGEQCVLSSGASPDGGGAAGSRTYETSSGWILRSDKQTYSSSNLFWLSNTIDGSSVCDISTCSRRDDNYVDQNYWCHWLASGNCEGDSYLEILMDQPRHLHYVVLHPSYRGDSWISSLAVLVDGRDITPPSLATQLADYNAQTVWPSPWYTGSATGAPCGPGIRIDIKAEVQNVKLANLVQTGSFCGFGEIKFVEPCRQCPAGKYDAYTEHDIDDCWPCPLHFWSDQGSISRSACHQETWYVRANAQAPTFAIRKDDDDVVNFTLTVDDVPPTIYDGQPKNLRYVAVLARSAMALDLVSTACGTWQHGVGVISVSRTYTELSGQCNMSIVNQHKTIYREGAVGLFLVAQDRSGDMSIVKEWKFNFSVSFSLSVASSPDPMDILVGHSHFNLGSFKSRLALFENASFVQEKVLLSFTTFENMFMGMIIESDQPNLAVEIVRLFLSDSRDPQDLRAIRHNLTDIFQPMDSVPGRAHVMFRPQACASCFLIAIGKVVDTDALAVSLRGSFDRTYDYKYDYDYYSASLRSPRRAQAVKREAQAVSYALQTVSVDVAGDTRRAENQPCPTNAVKSIKFGYVNVEGLLHGESKVVNCPNGTMGQLVLVCNAGNFNVTSDTCSSSDVDVGGASVVSVTTLFPAVLALNVAFRVLSSL